LTKRVGYTKGEILERERTLDVVAGWNKPAKPESGVNRREAEKAWGRNVAKLGKFRVKWTDSSDAAMRDESLGRQFAASGKLQAVLVKEP
jgi:hypothetical protein